MALSAISDRRLMPIGSATLATIAAPNCLICGTIKWRSKYPWNCYDGPSRWAPIAPTACRDKEVAYD